jgi:hypothetical protein
VYGCDILFDAETAAAVKRDISAAMGGECPCMQDRACPLLPADLGPLLDRRRVEVPALRVLNTREDAEAGAESASIPGPRVSSA